MIFAFKLIATGLQRMQMNGALAFTNNHFFCFEVIAVKFLGIRIEIRDMKDGRPACGNFDLGRVEFVILDYQIDGLGIVGKRRCSP